MSARSRDGAELSTHAGTWEFTTEAEPAEQPVEFTFSLDAPAVHWRGGFFTGICGTSFATNYHNRLPTFELMDAVRQTSPRAWSLQRDFWLTGFEHQPQFLAPNLPNIVRERETRRIKAIDTLGHIKAKEATPLLIQQLFMRDTDLGTKQRILACLGKIGDTRATRPLIDFLARDLELLVSSPADPLHVYWARLTETAVNSSWMVALMVVPIVAAYGVMYGGGAGFYLLAASVMVPFLVLPAVAGTVVEYTFLFARDDYSCQFCGRRQNQFRFRECLTRDHLVPLSRGGTNDWTNVITACSSCNTRKGNRLPEECGMEPLRPPYEPHFVHLAWAVRRLTPVQAKYIRLFYGEETLRELRGL